MFARVSTFEGPVAKIDEGIQYAETTILPRLKEVDGWKGVISLVDRKSGKELTITLWDSETALRASEEQANTMRAEAAHSADQEVRQVDRYEVAIFEV